VAKKKLDKYANDSIWETAKSQFLLQNENLLTERNRQLQQNTYNENIAKRTANQTVERDKENLLGNAAGRGMAFSSGYTEDLNQYNVEQQNKIDALTRQYNENESGTKAAYKQGRSLVAQQREQALRDAILRRTGGVF